MLIDNIRAEVKKLEKKNKEEKLPIEFKESFKMEIVTGDKDENIQNT